jgi:hypothetical protein
MRSWSSTHKTGLEKLDTTPIKNRVRFPLLFASSSFSFLREPLVLVWHFQNLGRFVGLRFVLQISNVMALIFGTFFSNSRTSKLVWKLGSLPWKEYTKLLIVHLYSFAWVAAIKNTLALFSHFSFLRGWGGVREN